MLGDFFNFSPTITEEGSFYVINGINVRDFTDDLRMTYGTTVIAGRVINKINNNRFRIHKFFMVELDWIIKDLINNQDSQRKRKYYVGLHKYNLLLEEIETKTWIKSTYETFPNYSLDQVLKDFTFTPFPDQHKFLIDYSQVKNQFHLRGGLLDSPAGSGKTVVSLFWMRMVGKYKKIILVPKHLVNVPWVDHLDPAGERYCFKNSPKYWTSLDKTNPLETDAEFYILYTENIRKDNWNGISFDKLLNGLSKNGKEPLVMVIDESHRYNNVDSQQTQGMINFSSNKNISDVLFMSGTPIKSQGKETYPLFCVIDPFFDKYVRNDFLKMYGRNNYFLNEMLAHRLGRIKFTIPVIEGMGKPPEPYIKKIKFDGVENFTLASIQIKMVSYIQERVDYYRKNMPNYWHDFQGYLKQYENKIYSDKNALSDLLTYRNIINYFREHGYNNFTDSDKSKFCKNIEKEIEKDLRGEDLRYFRHIAPAIKYVGLKIRGEALGNVLGKARIEAVKATIEHAGLPEMINSGIKKTAIYTTYIDAIEVAEDYLKVNGFNPLTFFGDTKTPIVDILKILKDDKTVNPLITTFESLGEGTPLLMCNQLIILNSPWRDYQLKQVIARIYRKGQDTECFITILDLDTGSEENITSRSIDIMEYYKGIVEQILNGGNGFNTEMGVCTKIVMDYPNITELIPFLSDVINYRPKFNFENFSSMFRK